MDLEVNPMNLTVRQLRAFVAVAQLQGFTAASRRLHLTQSALSGLVKELERALGVRLFDRTSRAVSLTASGQEFMPLATRVLDDIQDAATRLTEIAHSKRGIVRIAALELASCALLPPVMAAFQLRRPALEVRLTDTVLEQVLARVRSGEVDLGIGPEPAPQPELDRTPLHRAPFGLVCRRDHALARRRRVRWRDLSEQPFITMIRNFRTTVMMAAPDWPADTELPSLREVSLATTALGLVRAGLGVTAFPTYAEPLVRGLDLVMRPLFEPVVWAELFVFTRKGHALSPAAESFVAFMRRELAQAGTTKLAAQPP